MRSNSGRDESRNNMHDPTLRDRMLSRDLKKSSKPRTTGMGSKARKSRHKGHGSNG